MDEVIKNCVIYTRVSSEKQVDGYSLDSQEELCRKKAQDLGYIVIKLFREEGVSAKTTNRPQLQELLAYSRKKENNITAVFVYAFNRLNRNTVDFLTIRHLLSKAGISLISVTEPSGKNSPEQTLIETLLSGIAQFENETRARNVANSMRKRFLEGHITSHPPLGYIMQKVNGKSIVIKDPDTFDILKNLWHRTLNEKLSLQDVAKELNKLGVKSKHSIRFKKFTIQSISQIFMNKFYVGILVSTRHPEYGQVKGLHEPMVDETTFYQVRELLTGRKPKYKTRYNLREDFALRGIANCPYCERKLSSAWSKGKCKKYPYYVCTTRGNHKVVSYKRDLMEEKFIKLTKSIEPTEKFMNFFIAILKEKYYARFEQLNISSDQIERDIELLEQTKKKVREKNLNGIYTDKEYLEMKDEIDAEIAIKRGLINEKEIDKIDIDTVLEFARFYLTNLDKIFLKASPEGRLKIGCSMFPDGVVFDNESYRTPRLGRAYKLTKDFSTHPIVFGDPASTLNRLREFSEKFLSMHSLPDLVWWLYPELASKMQEIKE